MAFKNLEQRFNEKVGDLYAGAKLKFDGGRASTGINDDPLMVRRPGDGRLGIKQEGRSIPFNSAPRDVVRLTLFSASIRGIAFYAKQQLLQTGNTFEITRIINPAFVIGNAVPFLHIRRHLRPLSGLIGRAGRKDVNELRKVGQLQKSTYDRLAGVEGGVSSLLNKIPVIAQVKSAITANRSVGDGDYNWEFGRPELAENNYHVYNMYLGKSTSTLDFNFFGSFSNILPIAQAGISAVFSRNIPTPPLSVPSIRYGAISEDGSYTEYSTIKRELGIDYKKPSISAFDVQDNIVGDTVRTDLLTETAKITSLDKEYKFRIEELIKNSVQKFQNNTNDFYSEITGGKIETQPFLKYFIPDTTGVIVTREGGTNARDLSVNNGRRLKYLQDTLNYETPDTANTLSRYNRLPSSGPDGDDPVTDDAGNKIDPILISFALGNDDHVQFRAFIRDINQSTSPEYKTYQYIGRIEKFISYISVQREVNFKLDILSFSKDELKVVWNRLNYLTSLVFPYGINKGILQPNVVRFTIGKMFRDQPGYVTSLSTSFNEISESWDIDEEVPIAATVNIGIAIIEKTTMAANKPFYAINE